MVDGDLQHPPEFIPQMIEGFQEGMTKLLLSEIERGEHSRKSMTKLYYKLINSFVEDIEFIDGVGDFRLLSQRAVKAMSSLKEYNRFSKGLFEWIGYNTKIFTYQNVEREAGHSKWTFTKLLNYGIDGLISFNNKPLRAMIYLGMTIFSLSIVYILYLDRYNGQWH